MVWKQAPVPSLSHSGIGGIRVPGTTSGSPTEDVFNGVQGSRNKMTLVLLTGTNNKKQNIAINVMAERLNPAALPNKY